MLNRRGEESASRRKATAFSGAVLYIAVDDAGALRERLVGKGYEPGPLEDQMYGLREFHLRDPDGYTLAVTSPLTATDPS
jgi:uncharacterized glyoxalase superfamily protein PhnB